MTLPSEFCTTSISKENKLIIENTNPEMKAFMKKKNKYFLNDIWEEKNAVIELKKYKKINIPD